MKVKVEKLNELKLAEHPNNIEVGYMREGNMLKEPTVGECFYLGMNWRTSTVMEIIDANTFKTRNSIYKWTRLEYCFCPNIKTIDLTPTPFGYRHVLCNKLIYPKLDGKK